jgi:hypothetical protein
MEFDVDDVDLESLNDTELMQAVTREIGTHVAVYDHDEDMPRYRGRLVMTRIEIDRNSVSVDEL